MDNFLRIGVISNTHGIKGEVKVFPTTDDVMRFRKLKTVILDTKKEFKELEIENVKFFKQFVILKFKGIDNINEIEKYKGKDLLVTRENAIKLEEGEYFIFDLIGSTIITDKDEKLGELIEILTTGANDVYVIKSFSGKEILLPSIPECILDIQLDKKVIIVHLLPGLLD